MAIPIYKAVEENSMPMLERLLQQPDIDINYKTEDDNNTALLLSLQMERSDELIMRLIEAGCDPNISTEYGITPLHLAVLRSTIDVAHELIKKGCDINAQDCNQDTPIHRAIECNSLEAMSMLLYYGVDVNILNMSGENAFYRAILLERLDMAKMLMNCYPREDIILVCVKNWDLDNKSSFYILIELIKEAAANNRLNCDSSSLQSRPKFSLSEWDYGKFALTLISYKKFPSSDWLKYVYTLFESILASNVMENCTKLCLCQHIYLFNELLLAFDNRNIDCKDRVPLIYMFLNFGIKITVKTIEYLYRKYGFNEELKAVIYCGYYKCTFNLQSGRTFLLGTDREVNSKYFVYNFKHAVQRHSASFFSVESTWNTLLDFFEPHILGFFALSPKQKQELIDMGVPIICEQLKTVPEIPSLMELSRNKMRTVIKQNCRSDKPYQFYDVVRKLELPLIIQDIICFRKPLY